MDTAIGKVVLTPRGEYSPNSNYEWLDVVHYNGSSFIVLKNVIGVTPTVSEYYTLLASKGAPGADGVSISSTEINANGELVVAFSNGTSTNVGDVTGASAYEVAKSNGYVGDEASWLESLKGVGGMLNSNFIITTSVGVQQLGSGEASREIAKSGDSIESVLTKLFCEEKNPTTTQPSVSVTCSQMKAYEVGTVVTPSYTVSLNPGSYTYGPATGVTAQGYTVIDSHGGSRTTANGSFAEFTVGDSTNYSISATVSHSAGAVPKTNLGNNYAAGQINAGSKSASKGSITGYRSWFMYVGEDTSALNSTFIRNATNKGNGYYASSQTYVTIPKGTKRVMIALPSISGYSKRLMDVIDVDGMGLSAFDNFTQSTVQVKGANGYTAVNYIVYCLDNSNGLAATRYTFNIV